MSFQPWQLAQLAFFVTMAMAFWKIRNKYARTAIVVFVFIVFAVNPVRVKQEGVTQLEGGGPDFELKAKWVDESDSFEQKQINGLKNLKEESANAMD